ncbi:MAG: hypothetical protein U0231_18745 [Nitrospiraceae bacterium]
MIPAVIPGDVLKDMTNISVCTFDIQDVEAGSRHCEAPTQHIRNQVDGLLVGLQRFFETVKSAEFLCQSQMRQWILVVDVCDPLKFGGGICLLPPA